jgi:hypothetical protein
MHPVTTAIRIQTGDCHGRARYAYTQLLLTRALQAARQAGLATDLTSKLSTVFAPSDDVSLWEWVPTAGHQQQTAALLWQAVCMCQLNVAERAAA